MWFGVIVVGRWGSVGGKRVERRMCLIYKAREEEKAKIILAFGCLREMQHVTSHHHSLLLTTNRPHLRSGLSDSCPSLLPISPQTTVSPYSPNLALLFSNSFIVLRRKVRALACQTLFILLFGLQIYLLSFDFVQICWV